MKISRVLLTAGMLLTYYTCTNTAFASLVLTAVESNGDVIISTEPGGSLDLSGLSFAGGIISGNTVINPFSSTFIVGTTNVGPADRYSGITGDFTIGSDITTFADLGTGDNVGLLIGGGGLEMVVPDNYVSGMPLFGTSTYLGASFTSLGLTPGSYVWSWSSDQIVLNVTTVPIPPALWLFGSGLLGLVGISRQKKSA